MAETQAAGGGSDFDLSQFYGVFFEEAAENLDQMEQMLLALDVNAPDDEELNGIFRCAHSIKGGSATFVLRTSPNSRTRWSRCWTSCAGMSCS